MKMLNKALNKAQFIIGGREINLGKYSLVSHFLSTQREEAVSLTFEEIERIIDASLPMSAYKYREWWSNDNYHSQAKSWMSVGWQTGPVYMDRKIVLFTKVLE